MHVKKPSCKSSLPSPTRTRMRMICMLRSLGERLSGPRSSHGVRVCASPEPVDARIATSQVSPSLPGARP